MPYCSPEQLADLGPLLDCLRRWPRIREPRPGCSTWATSRSASSIRAMASAGPTSSAAGRLPPFVLPPGDQYSARAFQIFLLQAYKLN